MNFDYRKHSNAKFESLEKFRAVQTEGLREHLIYASKHSKAYQDKLKKMDCSGMTLKELSSLPFTEKKDIEQDQDSFLAVPKNQIADIVLSSGTLGKAIQISYTEKDLQRLAYNEAQAFTACGVTRDDITLLTCTMDRCFVAGLAYFLGMRELGAAVIRNGHGAIESHAEIIRDMNPSVIIGVPTFLRKLGKALPSLGISPLSCSVKKIICIGEPLRDQNFKLLGVGEELAEIWNAELFSTYASSETITTFSECTKQRGGHLLPELAIVEIIDESGQVLAGGEIGEVVITPLAIEGMPLIRYKTGDISFLDETPCACGSFSPRLGPILGRKQQRMKVKGTSLYPQTVYRVLEEIKEISHYYLEVFDEEELSDRLVIHVSLLDSTLSAADLEEKLGIKLRVRPHVVIESEKNIREKIFLKSSRKPVRFIDQRESRLHVLK